MQRKIEAIRNNPGISRVLTLDAKGKWSPPIRGACFRAIRQVRRSDGTTARETRYFNTMAEAQSFRRNENRAVETYSNSKVIFTFGELFERWKSHFLPHCESSTQVRYLSYWQHFRFFESMNVEEIDATSVDQWISAIKSPTYIAKSNRTRCNYEHEYTVLRGIFRYYQERMNPNYRLPFRKDHRKMLTVRKKPAEVKDLSAEQFRSFLDALKAICDSAGCPAIWYLARMQYLTATRIQEVAALRVEDFDFAVGKIRVQRRVQWSRSRGVSTKILDGTKADRGKSLTLLPAMESLLIELKLALGVREGLLFQLDGQPLSYRQIEYRFTQAFKQAGIPFQGTHIVRHAAISEVHARCKDLVVTKSIAGHRDIKSTARYTKAREDAVRDALMQLQNAESGLMCSKVSHS